MGSHIGRSTHCHRVRQMGNPCNIQSERARSELLDTVLEGPDQPNQVLSAHLAQVDRASLLCEPGFITSYPFLSLRG